MYRLGAGRRKPPCSIPTSDFGNQSNIRNVVTLRARFRSVFFFVRRNRSSAPISYAFSSVSSVTLVSNVSAVGVIFGNRLANVSTKFERQIIKRVLLYYRFSI